MTLDVPDTLDRMPLQRCSAAKALRLGVGSKGLAPYSVHTAKTPYPSQRRCRYQKRMGYDCPARRVRD